MSNTPKDFTGKSICQLGISPTTETSVPVLSSNARNPLNNIYFPSINASAFMTEWVRGRNTPAFQISSYLHSWATAALLSSFITSFGSTTGNYNDSDPYNWLFSTPIFGGTDADVFGGARCAAMTISGMNTGPQSIDMAWLAQTGASAATFGSYTPSFGQCWDGSSISFGLSGSIVADLVDGYRLNILRGQAYAMFFNQSYDPYSVDSGMLGGTLELIQSPTYTVTPGTTFSLVYYDTPAHAGTAGTTGKQMTITGKINLDERVRPRSAGGGRVVKRYTLIDTVSGGSPIAIT